LCFQPEKECQVVTKPHVRLPPLNAIRAFEAAARHESFTRAAEELNVTQAAISHQVKLLEQTLGVSLFKRGPGSLKLTERGQRYAIPLRDGLQILLQATQEVCGATQHQSLRISAQPNFAYRWLIPNLIRFQVAHPDIVASVHFAGQQFDSAFRDCDVAIRYGQKFSDLRSHLLFRPRLTPVVTPSLHSLGRAPAALRSSTLLRVRHAPEEWRLWLDSAGLTDVDHTNGPVYDSTLYALEAARRGLGVALGRMPLLMEDLRDGSLITLYNHWVTPPEAWFLVYPESSRRMAKVSAFRDWITREAVVTSESDRQNSNQTAGTASAFGGEDGPNAGPSHRLVS
jgi:LysR family glycine cleavage system transcriptional activator